MANSTKTIYTYKDEQNKTLFDKIRIEPGSNGNSKNFYYERIDEHGKKVTNLDGCRKVLYRLPELLDGISKEQTIFLVEGEKDADILLSHGLIATTAPITSTWHEEYTQILNNANVVLLYDNDKAGVQRKDLILSKLYGNVKSFRVIDLPGIEYRESHGQDVTDWLEMGNTIDQLKGLVENTLEYMILSSIQLNNLQDELNVISIDQLLALQLPPREMLLDPFLPSQGLVMIVAKRGVGKTHVALGIAYAIASGGSFLRWTAPVPKKVLYIDGEMPAVSMQERVSMITKMTDSKPQPDFLRFITPDLQEQTMPDLSLKDGRNKIEKIIGDYDLIVIDNISCLFRSGCENDAESWQEAQEWALGLRRKGKSVLFIHHAGKGGFQRGTSKREDILDTVIMLNHPTDYDPEHGARFEVKFDKARHFAGEDASSFQVHLKENDGQWKWELSNDPDEEKIVQIVKMKNTGYKIKEMVNETRFTKSQVETLLKKAKFRGML